MKVITVVRRYDEPLSYGFHYMEVSETFRTGFEENILPQLVNPETAANLIARYLSEGYTEDTTPIKDLSDVMYRVVRRSCPIEFHQGLHLGEPNVIDRIRVFTKEED